MLEIERTNERCIFLIENQGLSYYIIIPMVNRVKILMGIIENCTDDKIKNIPLLEDKVVVVPKVNEQVVNYMKVPQDSYDKVMGYFTSLINNVHGLLTYNKKEVDSVVIFNTTQEFLGFANYFVKRASGRVQLSDKDLFKKEVLQSVDVNMNVQSSTAVDIPVAYPNPNEDLFHEQETKGMTKKLTKKSEPGFVSYVLLGVVIAVASLIFLYMLL